MKKILQAAVVTLCLVAASGHALADGPRGHGHHGGGYRHGSSDWLGPLIVLGLAGAAIGAASSQPSYVQPQVTYVSPPVSYVPPPAPATANYYCGSVGQYYPNTAYCPEGWQLVYPR